jgi:hypothetical protein
MTGNVRAGAWVLVTATLFSAAACTGTRAALTMLVDARRLAANLHVQFSRAVDQSGQAVLADRDADATAAARAAEAASSAASKDAADLRPLLEQLGYTPESTLLGSFTMRFDEYRRLESEILGLAVENTNAKAQRLAFGSGREAADAFVTAVAAIAPAQATGPSNLRVEIMVARAVAAIREIQAIQARHIAEPDDQAMTQMEAQMRTAESQARTALADLTRMNVAGAQPHLAAATAALERFTGVNRELLSLSRRNSNVRSTALSLGRKRVLAAECDDLLRQLEEGLAARDFTGER